MAYIRRVDHVGITVADLDRAIDFFVDLGLEVEGRAFLEGEFLDTVCGIPGARSEIAMLKAHEGGARVELGRYLRPDHLPGSPSAPANELGLRNVSFEVVDIEAAVARAAERGYGWSEASAPMRTSGGWRTSGGPRGSSCRWRSGSADLSRSGFSAGSGVSGDRRWLG